MADGGEDSPHEVGVARCDVCTHEVVAVAPVGTDDMECPNCGALAVNYLEREEEEEPE